MKKQVDKTKKPKPQYVVYCIKYNNTTYYIGRTNNMARRSREHNRSLKSNPKEIHKFLLEQGVEHIELIPIKYFDKLVDAKRYECYLILNDYFGEKILKQKIPNISDR